MRIRIRFYTSLPFVADPSLDAASGHRRAEDAVCVRSAAAERLIIDRSQLDPIKPKVTARRATS